MNLNSELKEYFNILCNNDYPEFIDKYFNTKQLSRLKDVGQFCGCDYSKLYNIRYWYSRFDHSVATALITWHFTKDKTQTLAALFHDLGTPTFSHCIDFMLGDSINQETSEKTIQDMIIASPDIYNLLNADQVSIVDIIDVSKYPIIENEKPKLCADRLESIFSSSLIWLNTKSLDYIKNIYNQMELLMNEDNVLEIGFKNIDSAETFFKAVYQYSIALQQNEDKFTMQYIADSVKKVIDQNYIKQKDLYILKEQNIVDIINNTNPSWNIFSNATAITRTNEEPQGVYYVSVETKKRYVIPLCNINGKSIRLDNVSPSTKALLLKYSKFKDSKYCYIDGIYQ